MDDDLANSRHVAGSDIRFIGTFARRPEDQVDYTNATINLTVRFVDNTTVTISTPTALLRTTNQPELQVVEGKITAAQTANRVGVVRYSWSISTLGGSFLYEPQQLVLIAAI